MSHDIIVISDGCAGKFYEVINILIDLYLVLQTIFTKVGAELGTAQPQLVISLLTQIKDPIPSFDNF